MDERLVLSRKKFLRSNSRVIYLSIPEESIWEQTGPTKGAVRYHRRKEGWPMIERPINQHNYYRRREGWPKIKREIGVRKRKVVMTSSGRRHPVQDLQKCISLIVSKVCTTSETTKDLSGRLFRLLLKTVQMLQDGGIEAVKIKRCRLAKSSCKICSRIAGWYGCNRAMSTCNAILYC